MHKKENDWLKKTKKKLEFKKNIKSKRNKKKKISLNINRYQDIYKLVYPNTLNIFSITIYVLTTGLELLNTY